MLVMFIVHVASSTQHLTCKYGFAGEGSSKSQFRCSSAVAKFPGQCQE